MERREWRELTCESYLVFCIRFVLELLPCYAFGLKRCSLVLFNMHLYVILTNVMNVHLELWVLLLGSCPVFVWFAVFLTKRKSGRGICGSSLVGFLLCH